MRQRVGTPRIVRSPWTGWPYAVIARERTDAKSWIGWWDSLVAVLVIAWVTFWGGPAFVLLVGVVAWGALVWRRQGAAARVCAHYGHVPFRPFDDDASVVFCERCDRQLPAGYIAPAPEVVDAADRVREASERVRSQAYYSDRR